MHSLEPKFSLIIPTYHRPGPLCRLLESLEKQNLKPFEVIIVEASDNDQTKVNIEKRNYELNIRYYIVAIESKGSAQQRNYGIDMVNSSSDFFAFLDDDLIVDQEYFKKLYETYQSNPDAIGVGGIDMHNNGYKIKVPTIEYSRFHYYEIDDWVRVESLRNKARKVFGLMGHLQPGLIPEYSHGRSALPPNGKTYEVEHLMGGIASFKRELISKVKFSSFFEGYGLYEDFDFCVRALKYGKLYVNTNAKVWHYHEPSGRPDFFKYGKMVVRNGWYVWRVRFPSPSLKARFKWHATTLLLAKIRLLNVITGPQRINALKDYLGRIYAWIGVIARPPVRSE